MCLKKCEYFRYHGRHYQQKHLQNRLEIARENEDKEAENNILAIMHQERDRGFWRRMNYVLGKPRSGACFRCQVPQEDGAVIEHTTQSALQDAIWANIHNKRFHLAEEAPICSGQLRGTFGYNAICRTARDILVGTYANPLDFDKATKEILLECGCIRLLVPQVLVKTIISVDD